MKLIVLPMIFLLSLLEAQKAVYLNPSYLSQIRFSVTTGLYDRMNIYTIGAPLLTSKPGIGGEASITFSQQIAMGFGINIGIGLGMIPYNFSYDFNTPPGAPLNPGPAPGDTQNLSSLPNNNSEGVFTFPISVNKIFRLHPEKNLFLNLEAGIKINSKTSFPFTSSGTHSISIDGGSQFDYFNYRLESAGSNSFLAYTFKAGLLRFNKRFNSFHMNFVYQFSPPTILTGTYAFENIGVQSEGTMELQQSYLGIEFAYGLTLGNKHK